MNSNVNTDYKGRYLLKKFKCNVIISSPLIRTKESSNIVDKSVDADKVIIRI